MNLLTQARQDLATIVAATENGFAWPVTVTDPNGVSAVLSGLLADIDQTIDPDTGAAVKGRQVSVSLGLSALTAAGFGVPTGISDASNWPWRIDLTAPDGTIQHFKIDEARPDLTLGIVSCLLGSYDTKST